LAQYQLGRHAKRSTIEHHEITFTIENIGYHPNKKRKGPKYIYVVALFSKFREKMGGYVISNGTLFYKIKLDVEAPTDFIQTLL
jgi:hypothetical protein